MLTLFDYEPLFIVAGNQRTCDKRVKQNEKHKTLDSYNSKVGVFILQKN